MSRIHRTTQVVNENAIQNNIMEHIKTIKFALLSDFIISPGLHTQTTTTSYGFVLKIC